MRKEQQTNNPVTTLEDNGPHFKLISDQEPKTLKYSSI